MVKRLARWGLWLGLPVLASLTVWGAWRGAAEARQGRQDLRALQVRRDDLQRANRELWREVEGLRQGQESRERAAREMGDVVSPEEVLVVVPATPVRRPLVVPLATRSPG